MKTEKVSISTGVGDQKYPDTKEGLELEYDVPESVDEFISLVGEAGHRGSTYDLASSEFRTRFANTFRAKLREMITEALKNGQDVEDVYDQIRDMSAGWNSTVSFAGRLDPSSAMKQALAGKTIDEQIAFLKAEQERLMAEIAA